MAKIYFIVIFIVHVITTVVTEGQEIVSVSEAAKKRLAVESVNTEKRDDREKR